MGNSESKGSFLQGILGKIRPRKPVEESKPVNPALAMLDRLYAGEHPDYCLYLRPPAGGSIQAGGLLAVDMEQMLAGALAPLAMLTLDENGTGPADSPLPDEAFLTLGNKSRIMICVPMADARYVQRLRLIKSKGPLSRCIFVMPEAQTLGSADWPAIWPAAVGALGTIGIELSAYTPGGWLFRVDKAGQSVTFRPMVNPNTEKVARALEGICGEME